jgi:hypothetical protein
LTVIPPLKPFATASVSGPEPSFVKPADNPPAKAPLITTPLSVVSVVAPFSVPAPLKVNAPFRGTLVSPSVNAPANV